MSKLTIVALALLLLFFNVLSAPADDIRKLVITGGTAKLNSCCGMGFNYTGPGFNIRSSADVYLYLTRDNIDYTEVAYPGSTVKVRTSHSDFFGTNTAMLDGATLYPVYYSGGMEFLSGPVVLPNVESAVVAVSMPFTMTGRLSAWSISALSALDPDHLRFRAELSGQGVVTMQFRGHRDWNGRWEYFLDKSSVSYNFQPSGNQPETIRFSSDSYSVDEGSSSRAATVRVDRVGGSFGASSIDYSTYGLGGLRCQDESYSGAYEPCDFTTTKGTLRFAPGETFKTIQIPIINDAYEEQNEGFSIFLRNPQGERLGTNAIAAVIIMDDDRQAATRNPIDDQAFFIHQQYFDFLGRVAEPAGFQFWNNRMTNCPAGQTCDRIDTSLRFFQSDEFQARGFYVYRLVDVLLGGPPSYEWFISNVARMNGYQSAAEQRQVKDAILLEFVNSDSFKLKYAKYLSPDGLTAKDPAGFIDALCATAGVTPARRQSLINNLQIGARDVPHTVEDFIETPEISGVGTKFYDRGFITMQYFGYLRRDPEQAGFDFWVGQLIGASAPHRGDYRFMVGGFLNSDEYRFRFAQIPAGH